MENIEKAIEIAVKTHAGQVDKAGAPYIFHPLRVMLALAKTGDIKDKEIQNKMIVGVLHDIIEDTFITEDYLKDQGFDQEVIDALVLVTKKENEEYDNFIDRIIDSKNEIAITVKIEDLKDNSDLSRIKNPSEEDVRRKEKYENAMKRLMDFLPKKTDK